MLCGTVKIKTKTRSLPWNAPEETKALWSYKQSKRPDWLGHFFSFLKCTEFVTILLLFSVFWFFRCKACGILTPSTRDQAHIPCIGRQSRNHWATAGSPALGLVLLSCLLSVAQLSVAPRTVVCRLLCPWDSPGGNTGMGSHFFLLGIFPTQGLNLLLLRVLHLHADPLPLSHLGSAISC